MDLITGTKGHVNLFNEVSCVCKGNPAPLTNFGHDVITTMFRKLIIRPCRLTRGRSTDYRPSNMRGPYTWLFYGIRI